MKIKVRGSWCSNEKQPTEVTNNREKRVVDFWKTWPVRLKRGIQAAWDALAWVVGSLIAVSIRFDFRPSPQELWVGLQLGVGLAVLQATIGWLLHLYRGRYRIGSLDETSGVTITVGIVTLISSLVLWAAQPEGVARSLPLLSALCALTIMMAGRVILRQVRIQLQRRSPGRRTLIYGAGDMGEHVLRLMFADKDATFVPVGFIDDDASKRRLRMYGVRVLGTSRDLERVADIHEVEVLVVVITRIDAKQLSRLDSFCVIRGIELRVISSVASGFGRTVSLTDIAEVSVEDLLGRQPVQVNENSIRSFISGKRILVTGAGGSIGSELVRQLSSYGPAALGILDRDESAIQSVQLDLEGHGLLDSDGLILADIRDRDRMMDVMRSFVPNVVFHAAALKHLTMLERYPDEAFKTNVLGTANVLLAAHQAGVETFVNISTDKAADPSSILGASKYLTEALTAGTPNSAGRFLSVRFGNVLASRGSVLQLFNAQIAWGGPVTVTHSEVTRYFMTIPEAVRLVLQASAIASAGSTLILDMGMPVRIDEVARTLIKRSRKADVDIVYTGLRPGEKLHEKLVSDLENPQPTDHERIIQVRPTPIQWASEDIMLGLADHWSQILARLT